MDINHRRQLPARTRARLDRRISNPAGPHRPRGCRNGERRAAIANAVAANLAEFAD